MKRYVHHPAFLLLLTLAVPTFASGAAAQKPWSVPETSPSAAKAPEPACRILTKDEEKEFRKTWQDSKKAFGEAEGQAR